MGSDQEKDILQLFREGTPIDEAIAAAGRRAIRLHKQLGLPLVVWQDGKTVFIPPEELTLDSAPEAGTNAMNHSAPETDPR